MIAFVISGISFLGVPIEEIQRDDAVVADDSGVDRIRRASREEWESGLVVGLAMEHGNAGEPIGCHKLIYPRFK